MLDAAIAPKLRLGLSENGFFVGVTKGGQTFPLVDFALPKKTSVKKALGRKLEVTKIVGCSYRAKLAAKHAKPQKSSRGKSLLSRM